MADSSSKNVASSSDGKEVAGPSTTQNHPRKRKHSNFPEEENEQNRSDSKNPRNSTKTEKASGIIGNVIGIDYHFFVAMYLCLNGYKMKQSDPSYEFTIEQECKGAGKFDDIIYKYRDNESEEWTRLLVQIKYKQTDNKIKTANLLFNDKKETFSLPQFMKSIKEIEYTKNCFFIIYTSASLDLEDNGRLKKWYKKGVQEPITLLPTKVSCIPVFDIYSQYKLNNPENIPTFRKYSGIDNEEEWKTFLNKLVFVTGPSNLDRAERIIEETIEDILPKSKEIIRHKLKNIVYSGLQNHAEITSQEISELFENVEKEIQEGHDSKYEDCELEFECNFPEVYQFLSSELYTTLPIITNNPELTLIKVSKEIKKLREKKLVRKYTMKHVYSVKDKKNASSPNLVIVVIKNNDQLETFKTLNNDYIEKYIVIILNDKYFSELQNCYQVYRDVDHSFKLLTDESKQYVLNKKCISFNEQKFSFTEILHVNSNSLKEEKEMERLNAVITDDILICYFNKEYEHLQLNFIQKGINDTADYIKRRLVYSAVFDESKIKKFKENYEIDDFRTFKTRCEEKPDETIHYFIKRTNYLLWVQTKGDTTYLKQFINENRIYNFVITESELCDVDANTVLISDVPGMGKSFLTSNLFKELQNKHPEQIIIRLNFNDHTKSFKKQPTLNNLQMIVDFIKNELLAKVQLSELSQNVFHYILQSKNKIFIFLDGFDEICPDYNDTVVNFIKSLMKYTNCKLFVTTRPGQTDTLQQVLSTSALSLQPFTEQDKLLYLNERLGSKKKITTELLEKINKNSKLIELLGVPLLLKIVADIIYYKNTDIDALLSNIFELYKTFVDQKFEIYSKEKMKRDKTIPGSEKDDERIQKSYEEEHEELALRLLFGKETETYKNMDFEQIIKIGLISLANDETIIFIHRTFAEYFLATYIKKKFSEDRVIELLLTKGLVKNDSTTLRQFINAYIKEKINDVSIDKYRNYVNKNYKSKIAMNPVSSILHTAVEENNSEITTFILECSKQNQKMLDSIMSYGDEIALQIAIDNSYIEIAKQIIINYCDQNKMNKKCEAYKFMFGKGVERGRIALHRAASGGHTEVVRLLLDKSVSVGIAYRGGKTALHVAASRGHTEVVRLLLDKGASVDTTGTEGKTALHEAANEGHTEVVRLLLAEGASVDTTGTEGKTALYEAANGGHTEMVRLLLDKGANVDIANTNSWAALHIAANGGHTEMVRLLLDKGANVDIANRHGETALHMATRWGYTEVVRLLLAKGASMDVAYRDGETALYYAAMRGDTEVVRLLLANGASVDIANTYSRSALHIAANEGRTEVVRLLLDKGVSVNIADTYGRTALHEAARRGHTHTVQHLIKHGADINITNDEGLTALQIAIENKHTGTVEVLQRTNTSQ